MATISSSLSLFPYAEARSNKLPRRQLTPKTPKITTTRPPSLSSVSGGQATTYTRLPPIDDGVSISNFTEIKLSDLPVPNPKPKSVSTTKPILKNDIIEVEPELAGLDELHDSDFDYSKFELFEVNSDDEFDDEYVVDELGFEVKNVINEELELEEDEREKEKGVPAVMRCFDRAKIYVRSGDGGNGVVAFRREKFVPLGGPSGGDGGRGGNVCLEVDNSMNSLLPFRNSIHFRAGRGSHGQGSKMNGAKGDDVVVKVPPGTVVRAVGNDGVIGDVLLELLYAGDRALLLPGGRGGRGNASFKSGANKVPRIAEDGEEGPEM